VPHCTSCWQMCRRLFAASADNRSMVSNSRVTRQRTLVPLMVILLLCAAHGNDVEAQAGDFGFRLEVGDCATERLDTSTGIFTKDLGGFPARKATANITLTDAQMSAIYRVIEEIRFFDYPSVFVGVRLDAHVLTTFSPSTIYRFEVRNAGAAHTVSWNDSTKPTTPEADRLRDLFSMVLGFIHEHPEFKRLPRPSVGCE
jgi:hypothetical protein